MFGHRIIKKWWTQNNQKVADRLTKVVIGGLVLAGLLFLFSLESLGSQNNLLVIWLLFLVGLLAGFLKRNSSLLWSWVVRYASLGMIALLLAAIVYDGLKTKEYVSLVLTLVTGAGLGAATARWPKFFIPVDLMLATQVVVITLILPESRYYLQVIPFFSLALIYGLLVFCDWKGSRFSRVGLVFLLGMLCVYVYGDSSLAMSGKISDYNAKSHEMTLALRVARWLRNDNFQGMAGLKEDEGLPIITYLGDEGVRLFPDEWFCEEANMSDGEAIGWISKERVNMVFEISSCPIFSTVFHGSGELVRVKEFEAEYGESKAFVYKMKAN